MAGGLFRFANEDICITAAPLTKLGFFDADF
jgi:hypothetical protein